MLGSKALGLVSLIALGISLATPAGAKSGNTGGGSIHNSAGISNHTGNSTGGNMMAIRSEPTSGKYAQHDMDGMRMGDRDRHDRDHDHDRDHHNRDHFRFFPTFAYGVNTYDDVYDPTYEGCWQLRKVLVHASWRLHRVWVCNY